MHSLAACKRTLANHVQMQAFYTARNTHTAVDFEDPMTIFEAKSTHQLLKSCVVLSSCRFQPLVNNARAVLNASSAVLGTSLTLKLVEKTFYEHFCSGEFHLWGSKKVYWIFISHTAVNMQIPCFMKSWKGVGEELLFLSALACDAHTQNFRPPPESAQTSQLQEKQSLSFINQSFHQLCCFVGYDQASIAPKAAALQKNGITAILNYAAEDDVTGSDTKDTVASEASRDVNAARFTDCIRASNSDKQAAFIALKASRDLMPH